MGKISNEAVAYGFFVDGQLREVKNDLGDDIRGSINSVIYNQYGRKSDVTVNQRTVYAAPSYLYGIPYFLVLKDANDIYYLWTYHKKQGFDETFVANGKNSNFPSRFTELGGNFFDDNSQSQRLLAGYSTYLDSRSAYNNDRSNLTLFLKDLFDFKLAMPRFSVAKGAINYDLTPTCITNSQEGTDENRRQHTTYTYFTTIVPWIDFRYLTEEEQKNVEKCWQNSMKIDELLGEYATLGFFAFGRKGQIKKEVLSLREEENEMLTKIVLRLGSRNMAELLDIAKGEAKDIEEEINEMRERSKDKMLSKDERNKAKYKAEQLSYELKEKKAIIAENEKILQKLGNLEKLPSPLDSFSSSNGGKPSHGSKGRKGAKGKNGTVVNSGNVSSGAFCVGITGDNNSVNNNGSNCGNQIVTGSVNFDGANFSVNNTINGQTVDDNDEDFEEEEEDED